MDRISFERLYIELYPGLFRLAQSILRQTADAQDAVQQAVAKAWAAKDRMKQGMEKPYITRIVINECRNIQRTRQRTIPADMPVTAADSNPLDFDLKKVLESLTETLRLPLLLRYMEGYSEKEAAAVLGISVNTLKVRLQRAKAKLREQSTEVREDIG